MPVLPPTPRACLALCLLLCAFGSTVARPNFLEKTIIRLPSRPKVTGMPDYRLASTGFQINCRCWRRCCFQLQYTLGRPVPHGQCDGNGAVQAGSLCIDNVDIPNGTFKRGSAAELGGMTFKLASGNAVQWDVQNQGAVVNYRC
ncbi:hypothetical protein ABPG75_011769 [Micractinium tetrahymenae]